MPKPLLLDLFCGAGGAAKGYADAGFEVVGVDLNPQPHFPYEFYQADALTFSLDGFDVIHASPPCQGYSRMNHVHKRDYPKLIEPVREMLQDSGVPYVIENVVGAPLINPITMCGASLDLQVIRHRLFESDLPISAPSHRKHVGTFYSPAGHGDPNWRHRDEHPELRGVGYTDRCRKAMGIDWMNRDELGEAIPPAYTRWIGGQIISQLTKCDRVA